MLCVVPRSIYSDRYSMCMCQVDRREHRKMRQKQRERRKNSKAAATTKQLSQSRNTVATVNIPRQRRKVYCAFMARSLTSHDIRRNVFGICYFSFCLYRVLPYRAVSESCIVGTQHLLCALMRSLLQFKTRKRA